MYKIVCKSKGGPSIFLKRLERELSKKKVLSDDKDSTIITDNYHDTDNNLILRLDGIHFLKMSQTEVNNFIRYRLNPNYSFMLKINNIIKSLFRSRYNSFISPILTQLFFYKMNGSKIRAIKKAKKIIFQSNFSKECWNHFLHKSNKIESTIIYNGVDISQFTPNKRVGRNDFEKDDTKIRLITSGSFRIHKRLHDSLKVLKLLLRFEPKVKLYVAGKLDSQVQYMIDKYLDKNIDLKKRVIFLGRIPFDDLPYYYSNMDVMLHPSWLDPCPNVVVEALASGLPVICPNTGGTSELVGPGGIVIEENFKLDFTEYYNIIKMSKINYSEYAHAILKIVRNRLFYSNRAREQAINNLDIGKVSEKYISFIGNV